MIRNSQIVEMEIFNSFKEEFLEGKTCTNTYQLFQPEHLAYIADFAPNCLGSHSRSHVRSHTLTSDILGHRMLPICMQ